MSPPTNDNPGGLDRGWKTNCGTTDGDGRPSQQPPQAPDEYKPLVKNSKRAAVLRIFLDRGDAGLNCFEAVRLAHDYILRTTVSQLVRYHGIQFNKRFEQIPGHAGSTVDCVRYVLSTNGEARARELLEMT